ncbi:flagellin [Epibacterium ulvae]|uniref:flagellin n=1 Tax=Epibacterium ulvae TaxID=1156985 RepID=UPI0024911530|nr:flagellin [Epibacterium ulvae]
MSSILTNNGAMVALQTLKTINMDLEGLQSQISTGKKVANASDNSAVWAISKTMESDVNGFKAVSESLSLGKSTVAVAQSAAESVTDLLIEMKEKIAAATGDNVDRGQIQQDVDALRGQITSVVEAAQFNGLNLVDGSVAGGSTDVLASLNRSSDGTVSPSYITVAGQNLGTGGYVAANVFNTNTTGITAANDGFATNVATAGTASIELDGSVLSAGDLLNLRIGDADVTYTVTASDVAATSTTEAVAIGLKNAIETQSGYAAADLSVDYDASALATTDTIVITNNTGGSLNISGQYQNAGSGLLGTLASIDVTNLSDAQTALSNIDNLIEAATGAAAAFGSVQGRIESQSEFVSNLSDSLTSGIGTLVDADMEKASARLKALQTQQQLGAQALSIANSAPQSLLSLFR